MSFQFHTMGNNGTLNLYHNLRIRFFFRRMASSWMLRHVTLVRTDVSEELSASFIKVTRISELGNFAACVGC
jgi:hypothetical protein